MTCIFPSPASDGSSWEEAIQAEGAERGETLNGPRQREVKGSSLVSGSDLYLSLPLQDCPDISEDIKPHIIIIPYKRRQLVEGDYLGGRGRRCMGPDSERLRVRVSVRVVTFCVPLSLSSPQPPRREDERFILPCIIFLLA